MCTDASETSCWYSICSDVRTGERHDVSSMKLPRVMMESWDLTEDEVWENAMSSTYMVSSPRLYLNPIHTSRHIIKAYLWHSIRIFSRCLRW